MAKKAAARARSFADMATELTGIYAGAARNP
jgi:hypothetical protein